MKSKQISHFFWILYFVSLFVLICSVVKSGLFYQFDGDELYNSNIIYFILHGEVAYRSFYIVYSLFLHAMLMPLFFLFGFTFKTISLARIVMIVLFSIRLFLSFALIRRVFSKKVAYLFILFFLLDPFVVFASMQIRPENLGMVFFTLFLLLFSYADKSRSKKLFFFTGLVGALSLLTSIKIAPSFLAFLAVFVYQYYKKGQAGSILYFINGFVVFFFVYFLYFFIGGNLVEMFQQTFIDPVSLNNSIRNPTTINYFYFPNPFVYGFEGKALNWFYELILPVAAFAGGYKLFSDRLAKSGVQKADILKLALFLGFCLQWLGLLPVHSVFIQYYIPLSWFYSIFLAVLIVDLYENHLTRSSLGRFFIAIGMVFFILLLRISILANLNRAQISSTDYVSKVQALWKKIPDSEPTFPNALFRPHVYPITYGSSVGTYMLERYGPIYKSIEKYQLKNLYDLNDDYLSYLDGETQQYIKQNFHRDKNDPAHWVRR